MHLSIKYGLCSVLSFKLNTLSIAFQALMRITCVEELLLLVVNLVEASNRWMCPDYDKNPSVHVYPTLQTSTIRHQPVRRVFAVYICNGTADLRTDSAMDLSIKYFKID